MSIIHFLIRAKSLASGLYQTAACTLQSRSILSYHIGFLSIITVLTSNNFILQPSFSLEIISYGSNETTRSNCNCVVFRMDDIQDYWIGSAQLAAMNQFTDRNQSLTLGIIMDSLGNDSYILNKVREGSNSGLFELAVHGWNHTDHTKLTEEEQRNSMYEANSKMIDLFGKASEIFIPPLGSFNDATISAMRQANMTILNANTSSFNELQLNGSNNNTESQTLSSDSIQPQSLFYIPATIAFKDYYQDKPIKNSIQNIFNNVTQSVSTNGYAVIVIHPQDFVKIDPNGSLTDTLDENEINDLSHLIDLMLSNNIRLGSFSEIVAEAERDFISTGNPVYDQFDSYIINASRQYGITDVLLVKSMILQESNFDIFAVSPDIPCGVPDGWTEEESTSFGLMQVTPACIDENDTPPNLTTDISSPNWATSWFNPEYNINRGVESLSENLSQLKNNFPGCSNDQYMLMAAGAYNSGQGAIDGCGEWNDRANEYITHVTILQNSITISK
jgi:peptidoglycan/xylan/chitin deacetylase (PgdA/CDA1 family)